MATHPHEHNPRKFGLKSTSSSNYALLHSNVKVWLFIVWDAGKKKVQKHKMARRNRKIGNTYSRTIKEPIYSPIPNPAQ